MLIVTDGKQKTPVFVDGDEDGVIEEVKPKYEWTQTAEDFLILVPRKDESDVGVSVDGRKIVVRLGNEEIINGEFAHGVQDVTWMITKQNVGISGFKEEIGLGWQEAIKNDNQGKQFQAESEEIKEATFNSEELEEVDQMGPSALFRLELEKSSVSHQIDLSTQPYIFGLNSDPIKLCFRNLTDACVWNFEEESTEWSVKHVSTFAAFGYVQASKTQRKFITAPSDFSYVVISDVSRHLHLYRQPGAINTDLRNRVTGARVTAVAKQQLINLETNDEILGIFATPSRIHLLTKRKFYILVVNP